MSAEKVTTQVTVEVVVRTDVGELTRSESNVYLEAKDGDVITDHVLSCIKQATDGAKAAWKA